MIKNAMIGAAKAARRAANVVGVDVHAYSKANWRWSYNVETYYPVEPIPRWGHGKPLHPQLTEKLERQRAEFAELLDSFSRSSEILESVPLEGDPYSTTPFWKNSFFGYLDGA